MLFSYARIFECSQITGAPDREEGNWISVGETARAIVDVIAPKNARARKERGGPDVPRRLAPRPNEKE